jgi:predicted amidohydrolase
MKDKVRIMVTSIPIGDEIAFLPNVPASTLETVLAELEQRSADLVLFPQYTVVEEDGKSREASERLQRFAARNNCYVVYNALRIRTEDGTVRKSSVSVIADRAGRIVGEYTKSHAVAGLDIPGLTLGNELPVFELDFGKVALLAGTDLYVPEIAEVYSVKGAEVLLCSMGPGILRDDAEIQRLLKARAVADYFYVAASCYASEDTLYMASNVELYHGDREEMDVSGDVRETFNAHGFGKHTGRAVIYDLRGEIAAGTGRESGFAECELDLRRKRNLKAYNYGTGCILFHQNRRGVFADLARPALKAAPAVNAGAKPIISAVHLPYKDTFQNNKPDWYAQILKHIETAAERGSELIVCSEYSRGDDGSVTTPGLEDFLQGCSDISGRYRCYIAVNDVLDKMKTSVLFGRDGAVIHRYVKVNPLTMMYENKLPAGARIDPIELDFGSVGFMICADSYCQEIPRIYGLKGAELIILQTQSWGYDANAINEGVARAWAIENGLFVLTSAFPSSQVVHRSNLIDPTGETVFASYYDQAGVYTFQLDLQAVRRRVSFILEDGKVKKDYAFRQRLMDARRPELYVPIAAGVLDEAEHPLNSGGPGR